MDELAPIPYPSMAQRYTLAIVRTMVYGGDVAARVLRCAELAEQLGRVLDGQDPDPSDHADYAIWASPHA